MANGWPIKKCNKYLRLGKVTARAWYLCGLPTRSPKPKRVPQQPNINNGKFSLFRQANENRFGQTTPKVAHKLPQSCSIFHIHIYRGYIYPNYRYQYYKWTELTCSRSRSSAQMAACFQSIFDSNGNTQALDNSTGMQPACRASRNLQKMK